MILGVLEGLACQDRTVAISLHAKRVYHKDPRSRMLDPNHTAARPQPFSRVLH